MLDGEVLAEIVRFKREHDGNSPTAAWLCRAMEGRCTEEECEQSLARLLALGALRRDGYGFEVIGGQWTLVPTYPASNLLKLATTRKGDA